MQTCLNSPDPPPVPSNCDQRMSATGYEETELTYNVNEEVIVQKKLKEGEICRMQDPDLVENEKDEKAKAEVAFSLEVKIT